MRPSGRHPKLASWDDVSQQRTNSPGRSARDLPSTPLPMARASMDHAELHSAAASGDEAAVRRALQSSAVHVQEEEHGRSALMLAAAGGHEAVVSLLLSSGMRPCRNQARCVAVQRGQNG